MKFLRLLLFPFSILYGIGVLFRNKAYDYGIFKSVKFKLPVISVGNLAVGGSGKSPMTEYLIRLLKWDFTLAAISRGYGRRTQGLFFVEDEYSFEDTGDEPLQIKRKFEGITVAVCEDRAEAIQYVAWENDVIILDDAFQHRAVTPSLSILLFEYSSFLTIQLLLPAGNLREPMSEKKRANVIVITKCPLDIDQSRKQVIAKKLHLRSDQHLFFSFLEYGTLKSLYDDRLSRPMISLSSTKNIILLSGIGNPVPLLKELSRYNPAVIHHEYPDHHNFTDKNIAKLVRAFNKLESGDNVVITTEKDSLRLLSVEFKEQLSGIPVFYLPIETYFNEPEKTSFNNLIIEYASKPTPGKRLYQR
jgi:tetraacyldisaccharide 4'-kinase